MRFEIVRTGPRQFHARVKAGNNETTFVTETYLRRASALKAVDSLVGEFGAAVTDGPDGGKCVLDLFSTPEAGQMWRVEYVDEAPDA